jgi:uncharacterized membrane protein YgcG
MGSTSFAQQPKGLPVAQRLVIPEIELALPDPASPDTTGASAEQVAMAEAINKFSREAVEANTTNLVKTVGFIDQSFSWLRTAYGWMLVIGLASLVAAVVKGLISDTGSEVGAAAVIGGVSAAALLSSLVLKPTESMERNAIYVPWMLLVLNTYWTRLMYMNDPKTIDSQLEDAAKDAAEQFKAIAEAHAKAMTSENERFVALAGGGADGKAKDGEEGGGGNGKAGGGGGSQEPTTTQPGQPAPTAV